MTPQYWGPIQPDYRSSKFKNAAQSKLRLLEKTRPPNIFIIKTKTWCRVSSEKTDSIKENKWTPKIYICVKSPFYFTTIEKLMCLTEMLKLKWKYCRDIESLIRPDKIVLYFKNEKHLKTAVKVLRKSLTQTKFHSLTNAAKASEFGIEKKGQGLYIGSDPPFRHVSWRGYRFLVLKSIQLNKNYWIKNGGLANAKKRFNLSPIHNGPLKLQPSKKFAKELHEIFEQII